MPAETHLFPCLKDNYGVLLHDPSTGTTAAIDAPEAAPVEAALAESGWRLTDILVTHHHADHTGGIAELKKKHLCRVVAPRKEASKIPNIDVTVREGDVVQRRLAGRTRAGDAGPYRRPHHLLVQAATSSPSSATRCSRSAAAACSRATPEMMWQSLLKLRNLPADTQIYCGHEYTAANVHFALTIEPKNPALRARAEEVVRLSSRRSRRSRPRSSRKNPPTRSCAPTCIRSQARSAWKARRPRKVFGPIRARKDKF